jgi:hypothetical protein
VLALQFTRAVYTSLASRSQHVMRECAVRVTDVALVCAQSRYCSQQIQHVQVAAAESPYYSAVAPLLHTTTSSGSGSGSGSNAVVQGAAVLVVGSEALAFAVVLSRLQCSPYTAYLSIRRSCAGFWVDQRAMSAVITAWTLQQQQQ